MRAVLTCAVLILVATPSFARQFVTPLPKPRPARVVIHGHYRGDYADYQNKRDDAFTDSVIRAFCHEKANGGNPSCRSQLSRFHYRAVAWEGPKETPGEQASVQSFRTRVTDTIYPQATYDSIPQFCKRPEERERLDLLRELLGSEADTSELVTNVCERALDSGGVFARGGRWRSKRETKSRLPFTYPFGHSRGAIVRYLRDEDKKSIGLLTNFATGVSDKEAYVTTEIISGLMGRVLFASTVAAVVTTDTTAEASARRTIENTKANVLRMINNGGTVTGRLLVPIHATAGPTFQSASSIYGTFGLVGPMEADSLRFASSVTVEVMSSHAIRDMLETATDLGNLIVSGRVGYAWSEAELLPGTGDKAFPYAQLGIGLRKGSTIAASALVTWAMERKYKDAGPRKLLFNFTAKP